MHVQYVFVHACLLVFGRVFAHANQIWIKSFEYGHVVVTASSSAQICVWESSAAAVGARCHKPLMENKAECLYGIYTVHHFHILLISTEKRPYVSFKGTDPINPKYRIDASKCPRGVRLEDPVRTSSHFAISFSPFSSNLPLHLRVFSVHLLLPLFSLLPRNDLFCTRILVLCCACEFTRACCLPGCYLFDVWSKAHSTGMSS